MVVSDICQVCGGKGRVVNSSAASFPLVLVFWPVLSVLRDNCPYCKGSGVVIKNAVPGYVGSDSLPRRVDVKV